VFASTRRSPLKPIEHAQKAGERVRPRSGVREILQELALLGLWRSKFFEHAAFCGGTALRVLHGVDRFSEDLDFSLLASDDDFALARLPARWKRSSARSGSRFALRTR
jgi:predicted nucleotidyltransferase component of viral defense system